MERPDRSLWARTRALGINVLIAFVSTVLAAAAAEWIAARMEARRGSSGPGDAARQLALWDKAWGGDFYLLRSSSPGWPPTDPINREGLPDRPHTPEPADGAWRLVILGDSVTAGTPFQPKESFPWLLQEELSLRSPWGEVMTVALWGWSTRQERIAWDRIARRYRPHHALVAVCLNDIEELQNNLSQPPRWLGSLHRRSALVRRVIDAEGRSIRQIEDVLRDTPQTRAGLQRLTEELRALKAAVSASGAGLTIAILPAETQVTGTAGTFPQDRLRAFCAAEGLQCLDLLPAVKEAGAGAFEDIVHLERPGHSAVARWLAGRADLFPEHVRGTPSLSRARGPAPSLDALRNALQDRDATVQAEAAWTLGARGLEAAPAVAALAALLTHEVERVRWTAARALGHIGDPARPTLPRLLETLDDPRAPVRWEAMQAVWRIGPAAEDVAGLVKALASEDHYVRAGAAWCLYEMGPEAAAAVPALERAIADADPGVRAVAIKALARVAQDTGSATASLLEALARPDGGVARWKAARALGRSGNPTVAKGLVTALADEDGHLRREAATALGRLGVSPPEVVDGLARALEDPWPPVRLAAVTALRRLGIPERARAALRATATNDVTPEVREAARRALSPGAASTN